MAIVWQISIIQLTNRTLLRGVLLKDKPFTYDKHISRVNNLFKVVKSYLISVYAYNEITIIVDNQSIKTTTDKYGGFSVFLEDVHKEEVVVHIDSDNQSLKIIQTYPTVFPEMDSSFDVISDIDDTIIHSYTADFFKRISTLAFTIPSKRIPLAFTQNLFDEFKNNDIRVFYISKSESNLFHMLTSFIDFHQLPKGPLFLTPYLKFSQLFKSKKHDFKIENIRLILNNSGTKKFVLFGDDTQKDIEIYTHIINEFPERIIKVYIRQTKSKVSSRQTQMLSELKLTGVSVHYFESDSDMNVINELSKLKNSIK